MDAIEKISFNDLSYKSHRNRGRLLTAGTTWKTWKAIVAFSTLFSLLCSSFLATFHTSVIQMVAILYVCDAIYLVDTIIRMGSCILATKKKKLNWKSTFKLWLSLVIDVLTLIPFELIALSKVTPALHWLHVSRFFRVNRIGRFYRLFVFFSK